VGVSTASYPTRAALLLVIVCAFQGIITCGTSYDTTSFIASHGYDGVFGAFAGLTGAWVCHNSAIYLQG
jgi:hypothetical protein